jgi:hypothetical protein
MYQSELISFKRGGSRAFEKVVDAPEILTVIGQMPHVAKFVNSLHECDYGSFFAAFCPLADDVAADIYLHPHFRYFMRQVRLPPGFFIPKKTWFGM